MRSKLSAQPSSFKRKASLTHATCLATIVAGREQREEPVEESWVVRLVARCDEGMEELRAAEQKEDVKRAAVDEIKVLRPQLKTSSVLRAEGSRLLSAQRHCENGR